MDTKKEFEGYISIQFKRPGILDGINEITADINVEGKSHIDIVSKAMSIAQRLLCMVEKRSEGVLSSIMVSLDKADPVDWQHMDPHAVADHILACETYRPQADNKPDSDLMDEDDPEEYADAWRPEKDPGDHNGSH